jgi:hypothetical protein
MRAESRLTSVESVSGEPRGAKAAALLLLGLAAAIALWAATEPRFRGADGALEGVIVLPLAAALASLALAAGLAAGMVRLGFWAGVMILAHGAALLLVDAGNLVGYQHLRPWGRILRETSPVVPAILVAQAALVLIVGRDTLRGAIAWLSRNVGGVRLAVIAALTVLTSAVLARTLGGFIEEMLTASLLQLLALGTVIAAAGSVRRAPRALAAFTREPAGRGIDRATWWTAAWVVVVAALLSVLSYQRHPHVPDEVAYLWQAKYLARGMLTMPAPPVPEAFSVYLMEFMGDRWYSVVPPGWPLALAAGELVGAAWLVNPLLAGLCVLLGWSLATRLYSRRTARLVMLLLATSPWFIFMSMNFMTHTHSLFCALLAAYAVLRLREERRLRWALLGGVAIGLVGLTRPLEGVAVALLLGVWALGSDWRRPRVLDAGALALSTVLALAATFPYNSYFTGKGSEFPLMAYVNRTFPKGSNSLGFGSDRGLGWGGLDPIPGHGVLDIFVNGQLNGALLGVELLGWSTGAMVLLALALFWMKKRPADRLMVIAVAVIVGIHSLYWFGGGPDFGPRYWYLAILPLLVLCARGIEELALRVDETTEARHGWRVYAGAALLCAASALTFVPWRAIDKYRHYRGMRPDVREMVARGAFDGGLVLVRGSAHPDFASAALYNPIDPRAGAPVFAWDRSAEVRAKVLEAYRTRPVWIVNGPTLTGRGYEIVEGPVPAATLIDAATSEPGAR